MEEDEDDSIIGGEVAEWLNAAVLRTVTLKNPGVGGSNPTLSAATLF